MKKVITRLVVLALLGTGGYYGYRAWAARSVKQDNLPTTKVQRGDVIIRAFSRGELKAVRQQPIYAPNLNGTVQVTALAPVGSLAKEKDLIVEYDDSERQAALEEQRVGMQSSDEQIKRQRADLDRQRSQDQVDLLRAQYDVRRAELDVKKEGITPDIDMKKYRLNLEAANRALTQLKIDIDARRQQGDSQLVLLNQNRTRAQQEVQRELQRIALTRSLSPITGLVALKQNRGNFVNVGMQVPEIREGDTLSPGMPVADILDLSELDVWTKIGEIDRANLTEGQQALIQLDAIPDKRFHGRIKAMSGSATADVYSGDPAKKFDVIFSIDMRELLTGLNMKPADIDRIMATASANSKKLGAAASNPFAALQAAQAAEAAAQAGGGEGGEGRGGGRTRGGRGDAAGGAAPGGRGGDTAFGQGRQGGNAGGESRGGRGNAALANLSEADRTKWTELNTKMRAATGEEREKLMKEAQEMATKLNIPFFGGGRGRGGEAGAMGGGRGDFGGGFPGGGAAPEAAIFTLPRGGLVNGFTEEERNNAKLPKPPEQDSDVSALLRPGLLADIEIIVEKIPNALYLPQQAVFDKGGKKVVFAKTDKGFEQREVKVLKRSEATMVLESGVEPGTIVAMMDPTADKASKGGKTESKSNGSAVSNMPGGK